MSTSNKFRKEVITLEIYLTVWVDRVIKSQHMSFRAIFQFMKDIIIQSDPGKTLLNKTLLSLNHFLPLDQVLRDSKYKRVTKILLLSLYCFLLKKLIRNLVMMLPSRISQTIMPLFMNKIENAKCQAS